MTLAAVRIFAFSPFTRGTSTGSWSENSRLSYDNKNTDSLPQYTLAEVAEHTSLNDSWLVIMDRVYDVTNFIHQHPGGEHLISENVGRDATLSFLGASHSSSALEEMEQYCIGVLVESERLYMKRETKAA